MPQQYFYDASIRKWMLQIIRLFSEFTVQFGLDDNGNEIYSRVPVIYGDQSFSAATIAKLNSENVMPSFPLISVYVSNLRFDRDRTQAPTFEDTKSIRTRKYDPTVGAFLPEQGNAYTIRRFMPVPYRMEIKVDIVTSNTTQKLQILEQLLPLFNPNLEIQKTDNYLDWESLSYLELQDVTWSNRTIPVGQGMDSSYDVCTLQFISPIWLSLPAQVSKMGVIFKVIMNINELSDTNDIVTGTRQVVTFNNYGLYATSNQLRILQQGKKYPSDLANVSSDLNINENIFVGDPLDWDGILGAYGKLRPGVSLIGLSYNDNSEVLGTITIDPTNSTILLFNANTATLPNNTLSAINSVVNPQQIAPGFGLPTANVGDSYLITANIGTDWPYDNLNTNASAQSNDIITFNGTSWETTFSSNSSNSAVVFDNSTSVQYSWNGVNWNNSWIGPYDNAHWRLII